MTLENSEWLKKMGLCLARRGPYKLSRVIFYHVDRSTYKYKEYYHPDCKTITLCKVMSFHKNKPIDAWLIILQRCVRQLLTDKRKWREEASLALFMALHPRLGENSKIRCLGKDGLCQIWAST